ncbi:A/G-specific adenine glycosylase [Candidimonas nitroreducens]|uniref:Adenine DNA glycosylase n=1 Tax=Candidimonas nitroreducens TaxID=683354 RepID=A0A225MGK2_9BURK|nr:A/G-specific adenine glycosylase [Candidimonas nitroreducens]OWT59060.1 A/G-specific adenine glycosylase [Candidimonas nitroreducens]
MSSTDAAPAAGFAETVVRWQRASGRHGLPWQGTRDPYRIWLSEIMLQQTQVATVVDYYLRFLARFPDLRTLAAASQDEVMPYWAGLGYYARARNLHRCAREICERLGGAFPRRAEDIAQLPGIGRSTAAAIAAFAYGERAPIMDGNVKRVFTRYFGIYGNPAARAVELQLWDTAQAMLDAADASLDMGAYTQGLMDLGAGCCTRGKPACTLCPLAGGCYARINAKQHELPAPKPRKQAEERQCAMLILEQDGCVLLEQRPSSGIWGGLWCLPQYDDAQAMRAACRSQGTDPGPAQRMAALSHTFTHFKLHIEPWLLRGAAPRLRQPAPGQAWTPVAALADTALPAPVRKLLCGLYPTDGLL